MSESRTPRGLALPRSTEHGLVLSAGPDDSAVLDWDLRPEEARSLAAQEFILHSIEDIFAETAPEALSRIVHYSSEGDEDDLAVVRALGFVPEGVERRRDAAGESVVLVRSALLRGEVPDVPLVQLTARSIDGARPQDLVAEFHRVYGLPNLLLNDAAPTVDHDRLDMRMSLIKEEFAELCGAIYGAGAEAALLDLYGNLEDSGLRDTVEAADALADLVYVIYGMALESGIDLDRVLAEVHRSNLSKLMPDGSVRWREDGKVLKGPDFSQPDIAAAIAGNL